MRPACAARPGGHLAFYGPPAEALARFGVEHYDDFNDAVESTAADAAPVAPGANAADAPPVARVAHAAAAREIVKERAVVLRERAAGVG